MAEIRIQVRAQYLRNNEWVTIDKNNAGETALVLEGDIVDLLARWAGWFEGRRLDIGLATSTKHHGLCACCLLEVNEQGHAPDCQYAMTKALLDDRKHGNQQDDRECEFCGEQIRWGEMHECFNQEGRGG